VVIDHELLAGRATPPGSANGLVPDFESRLLEVHPVARVATIGGRYFGMDRDKRWERVGQAYEAIVHGHGIHAASAVRAVTDGYARGENDEFIQPTVVDAVDGTVRDGDAVVHFNFPPD